MMMRRMIMTMMVMMMITMAMIDIMRRAEWFMAMSNQRQNACGHISDPPEKTTTYRNWLL